MSSTLSPVIQIFLSGGTIAKGKAVKMSADDTVVVASAAGDDVIGICQGAVVSGDKCEVAVSGGAKGLAQATITRGQFVVSHTDGALKPVAASGDRILGVAMQSAVAGDIFSINMNLSQAVGTD